MAQFENWVLHLEGPSFLCLWLFQFVTSEVVPALLPDIQGCLPQRTPHLGLAKPSDQSWFGFGFFLPLVFSIYQRIVPVKSDFHW